MIDRLVIATGNRGKRAEIRTLLGGIDVHSQDEYAIDSPAETGLTFVENAILKARHAAAVSGLPALADDSGLEVDALNGAPGIYSARYAGDSASDQDNIDKLLGALQEVPPLERTARFRCVVAILRHASDPSPMLFDGTWEGQIATQRQGVNGFGYDPVFLIPELDRTAAQLGIDEKNRLSHRAQALLTLGTHLRATNPPPNSRD